MQFEKKGEIMLFTSSVDFGQPTSAQNLKNEIEENVAKLTKTYVLDYSTFNKHFVQHYYNNLTYSGAEILYKILTSNSKGAYQMLSKYNFSTSITNALLTLKNDQSLIGANSFSYYLKPSGGLCYDNHTIQSGGQILQIGKFKGSLPFKLDYSLLYNNDAIIGEKNYTTENTVEYTENKEFEQCYFGQKIQEMEKQTSSLTAIEKIIELSIEHRILSLHTAFLALEPGMQEPCIDCEDETILIGTDDNELDGITLKAYPNPFSNEIRLTIKGIENKIEVGIFDVMGKQVRIMNFEKDSEELSIDMKDLPAGVYLIRFMYKGKLYSYKIVKIN
jgi:hypothetical protein